MYRYTFMRACDDEEKFYAKMGRFFASRSIRKELGGYPLNNEPDWIWLLAEETRSFHVVGFINMEPNKNELIIHEAYVVPDYRGKGIFSELIRKLCHYAEQKKRSLCAIVPEKMVPVFFKRDFVVEKQRGQWFTMRKENEG